MRRYEHFIGIPEGSNRAVSWWRGRVWRANGWEFYRIDHQISELSESQVD